MALKFQKLEEDYLTLLGEFNTLKCKLKCKTDSLLILSHELEQCRSEKDQYKLMAEQLRERYSALKRRVEGWGPSLLGVYDVGGLKCEREKSLVQLLCELKDQNKALKFQTEDLKQRLSDAQGDIKILREEMAKQRQNSESGCSKANHVPFSEKEILVKQLEAQRLKCMQLMTDLQAVLDEKEELVTARDAFRHKYERLNQQLNYILRGDQRTHIDIDGVVMENRYLQERIKQVQEEKAVTASALAKCRVMLEKKRTKGGMQLTSIIGGLAISAKQVEQLLQNMPFMDVNSKSSAAAEFRNIVVTLLEALNDKSIALSHQKKANKILGNRISELEEKLKSMEVSTLWRLPDPNQFCNMLRASEAEEVKKFNRITDPHQILSNGDSEVKSDLPENSIETHNLKSEEQNSISEMSLELRTNSGFSDLDIFPTKENCNKGYPFERQGSLSSCSFYSDSKLSSASPSPAHSKTRTLHSDSEVTPIKNFSSYHNYDCRANKHDLAELELDDLPPRLQKMLIAALAELDEEDAVNNSDSRSSKTPSELRKSQSPITGDEENPSC